MNYGFDLDNVVYSFVRAFNNHLSKTVGSNIAYEDIKDYYWHNAIDGLSENQFFTELDRFGCSGGYLNLKLIKNAVSVITILDEIADDIYFVTGRPAYAKEDTEKALKRDFQLKHSGLHFSHGDDHKADAINSLGIDVFVEDAPHYAMSIAENTGAIVYLMDAPYNQQVSHPKITRVNSWFELLIEEMTRLDVGFSKKGELYVGADQ